MRKSTAALLIASVLATPAYAAPVQAVASFTILADMVRHVGGDRVEVAEIVGPNADSHVYEPRPADAVTLKAAQIFFVNGLGFEGWLERLVDATGFTGPVVTTTAGIAVHDMAEADSHAGHSHDLDPHAWQSLSNGKHYVANIKAGLCAVDPEGCPEYQANAASYMAELDALDSWVREQIAKVPPSDRKVITSHDAFGYFAEDYGVQFLAPEGVSTESEASAGDVARLITQIRSEGAKALFVENMSDPRLVRQIADETGARIGGALFADALSFPEEGAGTYVDMFRHNVELLVPAMAGK